jgi:acyl carrier protein
MKQDVDSEPGEKTLPTAASRVLEIVGEMSGVTDVEPHSELVAELGFDSLGLVELLVVLEDTLALPSIDIETLGKIERVADVQRVVQEAEARKLSIGVSE